MYRLTLVVINSKTGIKFQICELYNLFNELCNNYLGRGADLYIVNFHSHRRIKYGCYWIINYWENRTGMQKNPKLIYKSIESNRPTAFPAFFYGMPDTHVYVVYLKPCRSFSEGVRKEYVVALLEEFTFDYEEGLLIENSKDGKRPLFLNSFVDRYDPKLKIIKTIKCNKDIFNSDLLVESFLNNCINPIYQQPVR